jgi:hypothetical protein
MKVYALVYVLGEYPSLKANVYAVTHAGSLEMACRKFRVTRGGKHQWDPKGMGRHLPLPPIADQPEFVQVVATDESAAEVGQSQSIPAIFSCTINKGAWVCELPVLD